MIFINPDSRLTDLPGLRVGHWNNEAARTGLTTIIFDRSCPASCHVAGGAPGSAETDLLEPSALVSGIDAITLTGGSAFGLEASAGVRDFLEKQGRGFPVAGFCVPIVPTAVIFDLATGTGTVRPGPTEGLFAAEQATPDNRDEGSIGAGCGARVAKYSGLEKSVRAGLASRSVTIDGAVAGAMMVANCYGAIVDPVTGNLLAAPRDNEGRLVSYFDAAPTPPNFGNTAIGLVVTDVLLDKSQAKRIAMMAHDGLARTVSPSHTPYDGDLIFVVSVGDKKMDTARLGAVAAELVAACMVGCIPE